jgi:hypothetical protein
VHNSQVRKKWDSSGLRLAFAWHLKLDLLINVSLWNRAVPAILMSNALIIVMSDSVDKFSASDDPCTYHFILNIIMPNQIALLW